MQAGETILTGVKPTGAPHIGNYVGAIRPALELAKSHKRSFLFIADYHALNAVNDPETLRRDTYEVAACWLALGLNHEKTIFYRQSDIPEIQEITTILTAVTPKGLMDRSHAYKAAVDKNVTENRDPDADVNMGLYTYPILMAADILSMQADIVPVGRDQIQHIEFTRDIAGYFNRTFKIASPNFQLKSPIGMTAISKIGADGNIEGGVLPGIDGRKMSKSYGNHIPVFLDSESRRKLVMKIVTNSQRPEEPKNPDENYIYQIYRQIADPLDVISMRNAFVHGGLGYGEAKKMLLEVLEKKFQEPTQIYKGLMADTKKIDKLLASGSEQARIVARATLSTMREVIGLTKPEPLVAKKWIVMAKKWHNRVVKEAAVKSKRKAPSSKHSKHQVKKRA